MKFENLTNGNSEFLRTTFGKNRMLGAVISRSTYRIDKDQLIATPDDVYPVGGQPFETVFGDLPADMPFLTGGVDFFMVGSAHAPHGEPVEQLQVDIQVGPRFRRSIAVFGDRFWVRENDKLKPSRPEPFVEMPLAYDFAFGGSYEVEEVEIDWAPNPDGVGMYISDEDAEGGALPNLEDPESLITKFDDRPEPVGVELYPSDWALKPMSSVEMEVDENDVENTRLTRITPRIFNHAHPKMIIPAPQAPVGGDVVELTDVLPTGDLRFVIPDRRLHAHVQLEDRTYCFPLHLDQIGIDTEQQRVMLSHRVVFKYRINRMEQRSVTLTEEAAQNEPVQPAPFTEN